MNITQLQCFCTLSETLNYMKTAEQLHISQPAVSKQIVSLENELGAKLFIRSTHSVSLTPVGERFLDDAKAILKTYYGSVEWISSYRKKERNELRIGYSDVHAADMLSHILKAVLSEYDNVIPSFRLDQTDANLRRIASNQTDLVLAIRDGTFEDDSIVFTPLYEERFVCVMPDHHPLSEITDKELTTEMILPYRQIIYIPEYLLKNYFVRGRTLLPVNDELQNALVTSSQEAYILLQAGYGICLLPSYQAIPQEGLTVRNWKESPHTPFGIYYRKDEPNCSPVREFIKEAKALYRKQNR